MDAYTVSILRLIHILSGVFWVGSMLLIAGFIEPTVRALGPEGGRFMQLLTQQARLPLFMNLASVAAVVSGVPLYWHASGGLQPGWITSGTGLGLTAGGLATIAAFVLGQVVNAPVARRMGALGRELAAADGPPPAALAEELKALQGRYTLATRAGAVLLTFAVATMAIVRYL